MRRVQKILLGVFLGGVLLGGIGTGIAFVEYSSISYAGEKKISAETMVTKDIDFPFEAEKGIVKVAPVWYDGEQVSYLELDETVPEGVIRYRVTYNEKLVTPWLYFAENSDPDEEYSPGGPSGGPGVIEAQAPDPNRLRYQGTVSLESSYHENFGLWMENKDEILNDLKQGRIASYRADEITDVKIMVNPESADFIKQER